MVCFVALEDVDGPGPLLGGGLETQPLGTFGHDAFLGLDGRDQLGLDAAFELLPVGLRDIRVGPDDAQRDAEDIQGRLGLAGIIQFASRLQSLLDVVGQLLTGEVFGRLGLLQGGLGIGRGLRGRGGRRGAGLSPVRVRERDPASRRGRPSRRPSWSARALAPRPCWSGRAGGLSGRTSWRWAPRLAREPAGPGRTIASRGTNPRHRGLKHRTAGRHPVSGTRHLSKVARLGTCSMLSRRRK